MYPLAILLSLEYVMFSISATHDTLFWEHAALAPKVILRQLRPLLA